MEARTAKVESAASSMEKERLPENWSEAVEDLVAKGDSESAIFFLESLLPNLETLSSSQQSSQLQLASLLTELAKLYSSKGLSLKADELESRASLLKHRASRCYISADAKTVKDSKNGVSSNDVASSSFDSLNGGSDHGAVEKPADIPAETTLGNGSSDDDWEAIADRSPDELLSSVSAQCLSGVSDLKLENNKSQIPKRRGRGTFSYEKRELYSDQLLDNPIIDAEDEETHHYSGDKRDMGTSNYGTRHVLVLADFLPSTRTIDLEKLFEDFKDRGVVIRWVNDTVALAVFRTPSIALEALNRIRYPFTVRILDEEDALLSSIKARDLEPPRQRPKTSAQTAQRLIAQGMGLKLSSTAFGSRELKKQEDARRNRITTRQNLRDEAWGDD
ncbi:coiled-coil domain-containing protein R3HCC1L [Neltuma alba]|uniref:coiled-coil domain-containing protein R3HCC1L n=1 Tax=Neltuma alba TaxID=207710 RepID=UPI0010A4456F|nr:coiled-coil domain-containing protein R3HCC1L [Prosopis alba]